MARVRYYRARADVPSGIAGDSEPLYLSAYRNWNKNRPATNPGFRVRMTRINTSMTTGAQKELLWTRHQFPKMRGKEICRKWNWTRYRENGLKTRNPYDPGESYTSFSQVRVLTLQTSYSRTITWYGYCVNILRITWPQGKTLRWQLLPT
jgi:hypothetical protein